MNISWFIISERVKVGLNTLEWVDVITLKSEEHARDYIRRIREYRPDAVLGLRKTTEEDLKA